MKKLLALPVAAAVLAAPAFGATTTVSVLDDRYSKTYLTIRKGSTVKWVWKGRHRHNVYGLGGNPVHFHSPTQTKGSYARRFTKRGTYRLVCTYHSGQKMTVKVK